MLNKLKNYRHLKSEVESLKIAIDNLPDTYHSPAMMSSGGHSSEPSNPTERAAFEIIRKKEEYQQKIVELLALQNEIDRWIDTITDASIRSIIRYKFVLGFDWDEVAKVMHYHPKAVIRKFYDWYNTREQR